MAAGGKPEPFKYDPNPLYACEVVPHPLDPEVGVVKTWMAFDPRYGPESERQIEWHRRAGTPGASSWEVGKPVHFTASGKATA